MAGTLAEKVWDAHVVRRGRGRAGPALHRPAPAPRGDQPTGVRRPAPRRSPGAPPRPDPRDRGPQRPDARPARSPTRSAATQVETLRRNCEEFGVRLYPMGDAEQGIVHVVGPQLGLTQPGMTVVCGDSHTSTHGAFGALAFGIGTSEVEHVLATQTLPLKPFRTMAITVDGELPDGVTAKDSCWPSSPRSAPAAARATSSSTAASAIEALSMEARMTVCNMSIEAGARAGMIAPDETTFDYLEGRAHAPTGADWDAAVADWRPCAATTTRCSTTRSCSTPTSLTPFVTWGTNPGQGRRCRVAVPDPELMPDENDKAAARRRARVHGSGGRHAAARHPRRHRLRRLVHQRPHRGPARRRRGRRGPPGRRRACACSSSRARPGCACRPRARASTRSSPRPGPSGACRAARCAWHEPRPARARASAAPRRPTATSRAARARAAARTSSARSSPRPPPSAARSRARPTSSDVDARRAPDGRLHHATPASASRCAAATSTPTRSSRPSTSSGSRAPASRTACSRPGARTRRSSSTTPRMPPARSSSPVPTSARAPRASTRSGR